MAAVVTATALLVGGSACTAGAGESRAPAADLEREVKALAHADGCARDAQCRVVAVGAKACGGPRYYLPYCTATTDEAALHAKAAALAAAERRRQRAGGIVSDCAIVPEPSVAAEGGRCRVSTPRTDIR